MKIKNIKIILISLSVLLLFGIITNFMKDGSVENVNKEGRNFLKSNNDVFSKDKNPYKREGESVADKFFQK